MCPVFSFFLEHYNNHGGTTEISTVILDFKNQLPFVHQEFQVPKLEVLNLIRLFWGWGFPYISRIHTAYIGEDSSILGT